MTAQTATAEAGGFNPATEMTVAQVAKYFDINRTSVRNWIHSGTLSARKVTTDADGNTIAPTWAIRRDDVMRRKDEIHHGKKTAAFDKPAEPKGAFMTADEKLGKAYSTFTASDEAREECDCLACKDWLKTATALLGYAVVGAALFLAGIYCGKTRAEYEADTVQAESAATEQQVFSLLVPPPQNPRAETEVTE